MKYDPSISKSPPQEPEMSAEKKPLLDRVSLVVVNVRSPILRFSGVAAIRKTLGLQRTQNMTMLDGRCVP